MNSLRPIPPEEMLCFDVYRLQQAFGRLYKPLLDPLGLTYPQYLVMGVLWEGNQNTVGQIGKRLGLESSTLTPLLKRLEAMGFVRRSRDKEDERKVFVTVTDAGQALSVAAANIPACVADATGLSVAEIASLRQQIDALRHTISRK